MPDLLPYDDIGMPFEVFEGCTVHLVLRDGTEVECIAHVSDGFQGELDLTLPNGYEWWEAKWSAEPTPGFWHFHEEPQDTDEHC